ncbi:MAG: GNAT family N-acetyltransferase [Chlamydiae bacterium]|nr:GNAT family N-acetyltransferase [Chlamydiota bacterium]
MKCKFITPAHAYYRDELMLRWEVLRKPLGMPPGSEVIPEEMESTHLLVLHDKKIVGCLVFHPKSETSGQIMQLALSEDYRGAGCARKLMHALEQSLSAKGIVDLSVFAREELQGFYQRMGFHYNGESVERMGSRYRLMSKNLLVDVLKMA